MKSGVEIIRKTNQTFINLMDDLSVEQLNKIPAGFNNNIIWNFAHSLAVQHGFFYGLSGLPYTIDKTFIDTYKKGTKPQEDLSERAIDNIVKMFTDAIDGFEKDYAADIFKTYQPYTTSIGFVLTNIDEAIQAASFHDGWHFGVTKSLKKLV